MKVMSCVNLESPLWMECVFSMWIVCGETLITLRIGIGCFLSCVSRLKCTMQSVPGVWLARPNVRCRDWLVSGVYKVYWRVGEKRGGGVKMSIMLSIRCYLGHCQQASLPFLCILKLGLHVLRPSIDPEELDIVQCVLWCLNCWWTWPPPSRVCNSRSAARGRDTRLKNHKSI